MSTPDRQPPAPGSSSARLRELTLRGCQAACAAAAAAAQAVAATRPELLDLVREREEELDSLDRQINEEVPATITQAPEKEARELISCLKLIMELERVGDLLLNFGNRVRAVGDRLDAQDTDNLKHMAALVERMLSEASAAYAEHDVTRALGVIRLDAELDRLRNLVFVRHIENPEHAPRQESFHLVFMSQILERTGDHAKNMAEEVIHLVTGRSVRHLLRASDKPFEQMFVDYMRRHGSR